MSSTVGLDSEFAVKNLNILLRGFDSDRPLESATQGEELLDEATNESGST